MLYADGARGFCLLNYLHDFDHVHLLGKVADEKVSRYFTLPYPLTHHTFNIPLVGIHPAAALHHSLFHR